ncbi:MAG TPA: GIY-YIG nuclease family protein [bacterium]|nr:GIY-YIG nuclease family protein [bacterium]
MHYVYLLQCRDGSLYTGVATDLEKRLAQHMAGKGSKYVRSRLPFTLVYREECESQSEALKRECHIKSLSRAEKLVLIKDISKNPA